MNEEAQTQAILDAQEKLAKVRGEIGRFIFGQGDVVDHALTALLAGGHMLLIGVPGLAKTRLVSVLSKTLGLDTRRIQCTPDLMPSDIIGSEVLEEVDYGRRNFRFVHGPIFCQFLMVDEINRASPRTQSALLQAMQEKNITVSGREHALPSPFLVLATQNPLEQEGTYPLPEAQLDRFLLQINIDYPDIEAEKKIVQAVCANEKEDVPQSFMFANDLLTMQALVRSMPLPTGLLDKIVGFIRLGRPDGAAPLERVRRYVSWGSGPRASQALALAVRARALLQGRMSPDLSDIVALARPLLRHRMALNYAARTDGVTLDDIVRDMLRGIGADSS